MPAHPEDLIKHNCIALGEIPKDRKWKFQHQKQVIKINVQGRLLLTTVKFVKRQCYRILA